MRNRQGRGCLNASKLFAAEILESRQLLSAGDIDTSFGNSGSLTVAPLSNGTYLAKMPDDSIIVAADGKLEHLSQDGVLDKTFGVKGIAKIPFVINDKVILSDDHIYVLGAIQVLVNPGGYDPDGGYEPPEYDTNFYVARYNVDGTVDKSFATNGLLDVTKVQPFHNDVSDMAVTSDGSLLLLVENAVLRFTADGQIDSSFKDVGVPNAPAGVRAYLYPGGNSETDSQLWQSIDTTTDGDFVLGGLFRKNNANDGQFLLARVDATTGNVDTTFAKNGFSLTDFNTPNDTGGITDLSVLSNGKIVAVGGTSSNRVVRYNSDGSLDTAFGTNGSKTPITSTKGGASLLVEPDGSILVWDVTEAMARVTADGKIDNTFGVVKDQFTLSNAVVTGGRILFGAGGQIIALQDTDSGSSNISLDDNGTLTVTGSDQADNIMIRQVGTLLNVQIGGIGRSFAAAKVAQIDVNAMGGDDTVAVLSTKIPTSVTGGDGNDTLTGGDGNDSLSGNAGRDQLFGGLGADRLNGNGGRDKLFGGGGNDRIYGGASGDWLFGEGGNDQLNGEGGNDQIYGGSGSDTEHGNAGNDTLISNDGTPDTLFGDGGHDSSIADTGDLLTSIESPG